MLVKEKKIQSDLDRISDYCADSDLLMNYDKFFKITFSRNFNLSQSTYMMNVITIKKITIIRDIRVIFESRLIFSNQIESVVSRACKMLGYTQFIFDFFPCKNSLIIFFKKVMPRTENLWSACYILFLRHR